MTSVPSIDTGRGLTQVSSRAMTLLVSAVAAEALGVTPSQVSVDLAGHDGALDLTVRLLLADLPGGGDDTEAGTDSDSDSDGIQAGADEARLHIRDTVSELTGVRITDVTIRLTKTRLRLPLLGG